MPYAPARPGLDHGAGGRGVDRRIARAAEVQPGMHSTAAAERVAAIAEAAVELVLGHGRRQRHRQQHALHPLQAVELGRGRPFHGPTGASASRGDERAALALAELPRSRRGLGHQPVDVEPGLGQKLAKRAQARGELGAEPGRFGANAIDAALEACKRRPRLGDWGRRGLSRTSHEGGHAHAQKNRPPYLKRGSRGAALSSPISVYLILLKQVGRYNAWRFRSTARHVGCSAVGRSPVSGEAYPRAVGLCGDIAQGATSM